MKGWAMPKPHVDDVAPADALPSRCTLHHREQAIPCIRSWPACNSVTLAQRLYDLHTSNMRPVLSLKKRPAAPAAAVVATEVAPAPVPEPIAVAQPVPAAAEPQPVKAAKAKKPSPQELKAAKEAKAAANRRLGEEQHAHRMAQSRKLRPFVKAYLYGHAVLRDTVQVDDVPCLRPLAVGVHKTLFARLRALPETEGCSNILLYDTISSLMHAHISRRAYLNGMLKLDHRVDLEGNVAGSIDEFQRARALKRHHKQQQHVQSPNPPDTTPLT